MEYHEIWLERYLKPIRNAQFSTPKNCQTLLRFHNYCQAQGITYARQIIYFSNLKLACKVIGNKEFEAWERGDIERLFSTMEQGKRKDGRPAYTQWSIVTQKKILKAFFRWLYQSEEVPQFLRWLKSENPPSKLTSKDLLTSDEIEKMIITAKSPMWKGLIAVLTTGCRPGEAYNIKLGDIVDMGDKIKIYLEGKMRKKEGRRPTYILARFAPYLRVWLQCHPFRQDKESYLFLIRKKDGYQRITYPSIGIIISKIGKKVTEKPVYPYIFRHSIGTYLYGKYGSVIARRIMGHAAGSRMEAVYCHLNEGDIESALDGKPMQNNGFDYGNIQQSEDEEAQFLKFVSENKMKLLDMWKGWKAQKEEMP